jgi:hypothetical protein
MHSFSVAPSAAHGPTLVALRLALGLLLAACLSIVGVATPSTFAQATFTVPEEQANPYTPFDLRLSNAAFWCRGRAEPKDVALFLRTELYFGTNKSDGSVVTEQQFQDFLNSDITPRFPDGLTLITGLGQFRGSRGIERERSKLLILLYPVETAKSSGLKIEEIRRAYIHRFGQESVLRADEPLPECVSF